jgi:hypothetical protein
MLDKNLTVEQLKKETMKLLGIDDENEVAYIDNSYLTNTPTDLSSGQAESVKGADGELLTAFCGHRMAYGRDNNGDFIYLFYGSGGASCSNPCGSIYFKLPQNEWNHFSTGSSCSGSPVLQFRRR